MNLGGSFCKRRLHFTALRCLMLGTTEAHRLARWAADDEECLLGTVKVARRRNEGGAPRVADVASPDTAQCHL